MSSKKCTHCGAELDRDYRFCPSCAEELGGTYLERAEIGRYSTVVGDVLVDYTDTASCVIIPDNIREINDSTFYERDYVVSVEMSNVETVGDSAFRACVNLERVELGNSLKRMGQCAFTDCPSLKSVRIPGTLCAIPQYAFYKCAALTEAVVENGVREIGDQAFCYCESLSRVVIPRSVDKIGAYAFWGCDALCEVAVPYDCEYDATSSFPNTCRITRY